MQIAAASPRYVSVEDVPAEAWDELEREFGSRELATAAVVLLDQPFIKDGKQSIRDLIRDRIAKLGENIVVRRFTRYRLGEGIEKKSADFAAEVAAQAGA